MRHYRGAVDRLRDDILALVSRSGALDVAVGYRELATGAEVLIHPDAPFHPASVFKLCVLMEVYREAASGRFRLSDPVDVVNTFESIADGSPFSVYPTDDSETTLYDRVGKRMPVRELAELMIVRSSNLATNILIDLVTARAVTAFMHRLGATGLVVLRGPEDNVAYGRGLNNIATARGLLHILDRLARNEVVSRAASREMIDTLLGQEFNDGIPAALPAGTTVAHKTGWNHLLYHDAAIVYPAVGQPYVLVVLTRGLPEETEGPALVRAISAAVVPHRAAARATGAST